MRLLRLLILFKTPRRDCAISSFFFFVPICFATRQSELSMIQCIRATFMCSIEIVGDELGVEDRVLLLLVRLQLCEPIPPTPADPAPRITSIRSKAHLTSSWETPFSFTAPLCFLPSCITETERIFEDRMISGSSLTTCFFLQLPRCPLLRVALSYWEVPLTAAQFLPLNDLWRLPIYRMKAAFKEF